MTSAHEFVARHAGSSPDISEAASARLADPRFRQSLYREIHVSSLDASGLLRRLLEREIDYRRALDHGEVDDDGEHFENLYWCGFLLWRVGDLRDVLPMWRAKQLNMDTGCGFDVQFLVGAGVDNTMRHLQSETDPDAIDAYELIERCKAAGDFDELERWASWRARYFGG